MESNTMRGKMTDAQYRAIDKYKKANLVNVALQFNRKTEPELIEYVQTIPNKSQYFRGLLRKDMAEKDEHRYWLTISTNLDDEFGRTMQLSATSREEAIAEAKRLKQMFGDIVQKQDPDADWTLCRAVKDEYSMSGWADADEPINL